MLLLIRNAKHNMKYNSLWLNARVHIYIYIYTSITMHYNAINNI